MARPFFLLCGESGSVDRYTNLLSVHNLLERVEMSQAPVTEDGTHLVRPLRLWIAAVWRSDDDDDEREWDRECLIINSEGIEKCISDDRFEFTTRVHRQILNIYVTSAMPEGLLSIVHRIKPTDSTEWLEQRYEIDVIHKEATPITSEDDSDTPT